MSRTCALTGKRRNVGMKVSHSHHRTKKVQDVNIQSKRLWYEGDQDSQPRWVRLRLSTRALRTITRTGLAAFLRSNGIRLKDVV